MLFALHYLFQNIGGLIHFFKGEGGKAQPDPIAVVLMGVVMRAIGKEEAMFCGFLDYGRKTNTFMEV
jgi:hypothetical protein